MNTHSDRLLTRKIALWLGIAGILGSLTLFAGDMLFYYNGDQTDLLANMASSSPERIIASGICALIAAWLYTLSSGQIYYAFQPARKWIRLTVFLAFAMIMIAYGVIHGAYVAIAVSAKNAVAAGMAPDSLAALASATNNALRNLVYLPFGVFTVLFIPTVWLKSTFYPRWMILFSPIIPFLLMDFIVGNLEGKFKTIIGGGYLNLILLVFFVSSTIALFRTNPVRAD